MADLREQDGLTEHRLGFLGSASAFEDLYRLTAENVVVHAVDLGERALSQEPFNLIGVSYPLAVLEQPHAASVRNGSALVVFALALIIAIGLAPFHRGHLPSTSLSR
nr:hypothetical protein [Amycolatopsis nigrescens]